MTRTDERLTPAIAVKVAPTTARQHISGGMALNIPNDWLLNGGDWHQHAAWFATTAETLRPTDITDEATYGRLLDLLGRTGTARRASRPATTRPPRWVERKQDLGRYPRTGNHRMGMEKAHATRRDEP